MERLTKRPIGRLASVAVLAALGVLVWVVVAGGTQPYETYETAVATDGPTAQFRFDEAVGSTTIADSAGSFTAADNGVTLGDAGPFAGSKAGAFDGESSYAALPASPLAGQEAFSAEAWVYWTGGTSYDQPVFDFGSSATNYMYLTPASALTNHPMLFEIRTGAGSAVQVQAPTLTAKAWEYVAVTETGSGTLTLYLNGEQIGQTAGATISPASLGSTANDWLGKSQISTDPLFTGSLSNVAFYAKALSAEQVLKHYDAAEFPVNSTLPTISGTPTDGQTLSASTGSWSGVTPMSFGYQWLLCNVSGAECANISGATSSSYRAEHEDVGHTLRVTVSASNSAGSGSATSPQTATVTGIPPSNTALPAISGIAQDGLALSASAGSWNGTPPFSYAYQWESCNSQGAECQEIQDATAQTYTLSAGDLATTLRVVVTASNVAGSAKVTSAASPQVQPGPPSELGPPSISGVMDAARTLQADAGVWDGNETRISYRWQRCSATGVECVDIAGANDSERALEEGDVGRTLRVRIGASNAMGSVTALSSATPVIGASTTLESSLSPNISGTPRIGQTLAANTGSWLGQDTIGYAYQWQRCDVYGLGCKDIEGATSATYTLVSTDVASTVRVLITTTDAIDGKASEVSPVTQPVAAAGAPVSEQAPSISGAGLVSQTILASAGGWAGEGPITYVYQWQRCSGDGEACASIEGATGVSYALTEADVGFTVRAKVTASTGGGSTSAVTFPITVSSTTLANVVAPSISGPAQTWSPLTAEPGLWTGAGAIAYAYQWERCNAQGKGCKAITGANETSYTPNASDVSNTIVLTMTATSGTSKVSASSASSPLIAAVEAEPVNTTPPSIEGYATAGDTLTARPGSWSGTEPITYLYQWERCNAEGEECIELEGAEAETYVLQTADIGSKLRLWVRAINSLGRGSEISEETEVIDAPGPPQNTEAPTIRGTFKVGEQLFAGNGTWLGSRPLTFFYRWERCNTSGEACNPIEAATKPSYTLATADANSEVRVRVTVTNSLGSVSAVSAASLVTPAGQAEAAQATELAERTDPSVLAPSTSATVEEQAVKPAVEDPGEELSSNTTLTTSSVSKETSGELAVNTPAGQLSLVPVDTSANATTLPTIVNGTAAVYAETSHATDTIVRPDPLGATTLLQLRSSEAPRSFSWEVGLGADQELQQLPDGSVAVTEPPPGTIIEGSLPEEPLGPGEPEPPAETAGQEGVNGSAADGELEGSLKEEGTLEKLPAAPQTTTSPITPRAGELHPQETQAKYEAAKNAVGYAETQTGGTTLMVIEPPKVLDAAGNAVPAAFSVQGQTVTLTMTPNSGAAFPVTAETSVAAPSDQASTARAHGARYGLSDQKPASFTISEEKGEPVEHFDTRLKTGQLHIGTARLVLPYNTAPTDEKLIAWLTAVGKAGLRPYITFGPPTSEFCAPGSPCPEPKLGLYKEGITRLVGALMARHRSEPSVIPAITLWGAWNEPDRSPMRAYPGQAALFWKVARAILKSKGCACTLVAGEFAEYSSYIKSYEKAILKDHHYWSRKPHVWGFHDYGDLVNFYRERRNPAATAFAHITAKRLGYPRLLFSEQGVELQSNENATALEGHLGRQKLAAEDFLKLSGISKRIDLVDYYEYRGPNAEERARHKAPHDFDSGLLPGEGKEPSDWRPAYCVLALGRKGCPAKAATEAPVANTTTETATTTLLTVDPGETQTSYWVAYGTTAAYGQVTARASLANPEGMQSATVGLSRLQPCTIYHYQAEAENEGNEGVPSLGGDRTFRTGGCVAKAVDAFGSPCALQSTATVDCWGGDKWGELGNGEMTENATTVPTPVPGITGVKAVGSGSGNTCVLFEAGNIDCWGAGYLGNGTTEPSLTPVAVSGITTAISISTRYDHPCAVLSSGSIECWGWIFGGSLGNGTEESSTVPVLVSNIVNGISVSVGSNHMCALLSSGRVDCWGTKYFGQLGDGESTLSNAVTPIQVSGITNATAISSGVYSSCALLSSGGIDCWGDNSLGQLGDGGSEITCSEHPVEPCCGLFAEVLCSRTPVPVSGISDAVAVSVGWSFACAVLTNGTIECWGVNGGGQLGDGTNTGSVCGLSSEQVCRTTPVAVSGINDAIGVSAGAGGACALLVGGRLKCWGGNSRGELGDGTWPEPSFTPVPVVGYP